MSRFVLMAAIVGAYAAEQAAAETAFLAALEDVPLAPGFVEVEGAGAAFTGREGVVLTALARGPAAAPEVAAFYRQTLPALGWGALGGGEGSAAPLAFVRGREKLLVDLDRTQSAELEVRYTLVAAPPPRTLD